MNNSTERFSAFYSWIVIVLLLLLILVGSLVPFVLVGDLGPPDWSYGVIQDVPAESPYAEYGVGEPEPQHIKGAKGE